MKKMVILAVVGSKNSGKTTTVELLVEALTKEGHKVATVKRIHEPDFTIDTPGKDSWKHAKAGARTVVCVAPKEMTIIRKVDTTKISLEQIVTKVRNEAEIIVLEGFKNLVKQNPTIPKIVAVKTAEEVTEVSKMYHPILALVGVIPNPDTIESIRYVDVLKKPEDLVKLVNHEIKVSLRKQ